LTQTEIRRDQKPQASTENGVISWWILGL